MHGDPLIRLIEARRPLKLGDSDRRKSAVQLDATLQDQLDANKLAWLIGKGYAFSEQQAGRHRPGRSSRTATELAPRTGHPSVLLTPAGVSLVDYLVDCMTVVSGSICQAGNFDQAGSRIPLSTLFLHPELTPHRDNRTYDLWAGAILVKSYCRYAPNQMDVLDTFQQQGWPRRIDNPLCCEDYDVDPRERLHDTIKDLNRSLDVKIVRFRGDGTGRGVIWEFCQRHADSQSLRRLLSKKR